MRVIFFVSRRVRKKYVETLMSRNKSKDDVFFDPHRYLIVGTHMRYGAVVDVFAFNFHSDAEIIDSIRTQR